MEFEEYLSQTNNEKIKYLMKKWNLEKPVLMGKVTKKHDSYIGIEKIFSIEGNSIVNPFSDDGNTWVFCSIGKDDDMKISEGDQVLFEFSINTRTFKENDDAKQRLIIGESVKKLIDIEKIKTKPCDDILGILRNKNNPLIDKTLISEDIALMLDEKEKDLEFLNEKNKNLSKELDDKIRFKEELEKYGFKFDFEHKDKSNCMHGITDIQKEEYIRYIQSYLVSRENKKLYYEQEVLEQFYAGLCTNQLLILSGQPGTGKTSLVEGFCDAIGAKLKIISVQPNWTDNQDLIGFYNPIENTYISTPFLDAIIEAKENPEFLYIVCLDEMNLAYVEYYFSEFLSKMQSESKTINLYSDYLYKQAKDEIITKLEFLIRDENLNMEDKIDKLKDMDINEYYKLKKQWNSLNRYPSNLEVPDNLRFVGTINKDETTKDLSPKVIDRSYIIDINGYDRQKVDNQVGSFDVSRGRLYLDPSKFSEGSKNIAEELKVKLDVMKIILGKINIELTNRIIKHIEQLTYADIFNRNDMFDVIVATKIFPKINVEVDDENIIREMKQYIANTTFSARIFDKMEHHWNETGMLTFWR